MSTTTADSNAGTLVASSGPTLVGVRFESGRPAEKDELLDAVDDQKTAKIVLLRDVQIINKYYDVSTFRAVGNTDNKECASEVECVELSKRRAVLLHEWLIKNGVPSRNLLEPVGYGRSRPLQDNSKPEGRRVNRNAFIELESLDP